jgi:signal-transduction protein with cAMP-binding, CBS, and nucleotidyltransferase domain
MEMGNAFPVSDGREPAMQVTVREAMSPFPSAIPERSTIGEALDRMIEEGVSELYVTDESGRLLGVVPDYELLKAHLAHVDGREPIDGLMSRSILTTEPRCALAALAPVFRASFCRRMAVVQDGRLVGQIDRRDVLRLLREESAGLPARDDASGAPSIEDLTRDNAPLPIRGPRFRDAASCNCVESEA